MSDLTVDIESSDGDLLATLPAASSTEIRRFYVTELQTKFPHLKNASITSLEPSDNLFLPAGGKPLAIAKDRWKQPLSTFPQSAPNTVTFVLKVPAFAHDIGVGAVGGVPGDAAGIRSDFHPVLGSRPSYFNKLDNAICCMLDDEGNPVACGVFISPTQALTVWHDAKLSEGGTVRVCTPFSVNSQHARKYRALRVHPNLDYIILELLDGEAPAEDFFILPSEAVSLVGRPVTILYFNISRAAHADNKKGEYKSLVGAEFTTIKAATDRHFAYSECAEGVSGGAVVVLTETGVAVGLHLGGFNHASESNDELLPSDVLATRDADRMDAADIVTESVKCEFRMLTKKVSTGGWALILSQQLLSKDSSVACISSREQYTSSKRVD